VQAFAAGNVLDFDIKFITPLRWKHAGGERQLSLLIVRPIAYRLRKGAHLSYRKPAYLISSDPTLAPQQILQAYLWRWDILCGGPHKLLMWCRGLCGVGDRSYASRAKT
jgi:hypothetical protein